MYIHAFRKNGQKWFCETEFVLFLILFSSGNHRLICLCSKLCTAKVMIESVYHSSQNLNSIMLYFILMQSFVHDKVMMVVELIFYCWAKVYTICIFKCWHYKEVTCTVYRILDVFSQDVHVCNSLKENYWLHLLYFMYDVTENCVDATIWARGIVLNITYCYIYYFAHLSSL